ncbi:MAG: ribosome biogenesis GTPase Der [Pseudomonadota bacterium]|nr:ribosome biogenesis GTPase Der [Pseudomonadota bacterium]
MTVQSQASNKPTIAIVGRPNVGKSTLYNRLTRSRDALVADVPGLTRDPKVGVGRLGEAGYIAVDTGGIDDAASDELSHIVARHALDIALDCDAAILMVDGRAGINASDQHLVRNMRKAGVEIFLAVNKTEGQDPDIAVSEFAVMGIPRIHAISATHGHGVASLIAAITTDWPKAVIDIDDTPGDRIRVAVIGRPNVGKSTLVNRLLGQDRMITCDVPGTTRDSIDSDFERDGQAYTVIDTAGLRRKRRARGVAEKFSAIQALQALERAQIALLVLDARESVTDQDLNLLGMIIDAGRALVVAVNKWDGLNADERLQIRRDLNRRLQFADYAEIRCISALHGSGVGELVPAIVAAWRSAFVAPKTSHLSSMLEEATDSHQPPLVRGRRIKLRFAHLGGKNPPRIVIHGNQIEAIPGSYKRYLANYFRESLGLVGTPVHLEFRQGENPFAGRRNKLNKRQINKRRRLMSHVKRKK